MKQNYNIADKLKTIKEYKEMKKMCLGLDAGSCLVLISCQF
jgi:hypothetical protein